MNVESVRFGAPGQPQLEGRLAVPPVPRGVVILCHAYPPLGGSMSNVPIVALWRSLYAAGWAALRFNFRGVGRSDGQFDGGYGETRDALAAARTARESAGRDLPVAFVGWSFGSIVALRATAEQPETAACVALAPPMSAGHSLRLPLMPDEPRLREIGARTLLICGTEDAVSQPDDVQRLAQTMHASVRVLRGAGHFFDGALADVTAIVAAFLDERLSREEQEADGGGQQ